MYTRVCYLYRDASNYKFWGYFILDGAVLRDEAKPYLIDGEWIIPEVIGLDPLRPIEKTEDDHRYHELHEFEEVGVSEAAGIGAPLCSAGEFIRRLKKVNMRWDELFCGLMLGPATR
ncbi:MAG: hypothetical protein QM698_13745 [Micropepsaceae bacterium]